MYELIKRDGRAKRGRFHTVHGVIETPVFMNVGTIAAIKGAVSTADLEEIGTQVERITDMEVDFAKWYTDVCTKAELIDYTSTLCSSD